jgi:hypothetical protein
MSASDATMKLERILGETRAKQLISEIMAERGLSSLDSPDARASFASGLIERGGVIEAIGRAIRVQAILHGASKDA